MSTGSLLPLERQFVALSFSVAGTLMRVYLHGARRPRGEELLREMQAKSASMCEVTFGLDICVKRGDFEHP